MKNPRLIIGNVPLDAFSLKESLDAIEFLVNEGKGGAVFTPNIHHLIWAQKLKELKQVYKRASLCLVDDSPLYWITAFMGKKFPEKVSGSDLILPLMERSEKKGWGVFLLGGKPGVGQKAANKMSFLFPRLRILGIESPSINLNPRDPSNWKPLADIQKTKPDILLVALGCPKQELWIDRNRKALGSIVSLGIGASLDFISGRIKRAPRILSRVGLEGAYRLYQEPRRLWHRYLIESFQFLPILFQTAIRPKNKRLKEGFIPYPPLRDLSDPFSTSNP